MAADEQLECRAALLQAYHHQVGVDLLGNVITRWAGIGGLGMDRVRYPAVAHCVLTSSRSDGDT